MIRAVLDANVFISAALKPQGPPGQLTARFLSASAFALVIAPAIIDEVARVLDYPKIRRLVDRERTRLWFEEMVLLADLVPGDIVVSGVCEDPDDDKYLAAAIEGRAAFVVTGDRLLLAVGKHEGVRVVKPRAFLTLLDASR